MREITRHHDGFGLNDSIRIVSDDRDETAGNGSHVYVASIADGQVAHLQFQHGPRNVEGSTPGLTTTALLAILIDHLQGFQEGPYKSREGAIALTHLETAMLWLEQRTRERALRQVLGTYQK
jgi:hypothetical protein